MRVVHFSRGFEDYVISLANGLAGLVDLTLVLASADEWMAQHISDRVQIRFSGAPRVSDLGNLPAMLRLARQIRECKPDVLHFQNGVVWEGIVALLNRGIPCVTTIHDVTRHPMNSLVSRGTPQPLLDQLPRHSGAIIVHGHRLAGYLRQRFNFGTREPLIRVIPHPIISRYGTGAGRVERGRNVLFFGYLDKYKGVEVLLRAMPLLAATVGDVTLRVAGRAASADYYRQLTPPGVNVDWDLRYQDDTDVSRAFTWADVVVLPYIEASQSGVLHLAASFAVPVVATRVGSLPDAVCHEKNGLLVEPGDAESLARELSRALLDTKLRARLIAGLVEDRNAALAANGVATATADLYREVAQLPSRRQTS